MIVRKQVPKNALKHGAWKKERLYFTWQSMKQRCRDKKASNYKYYGAKGIDVFPLWKSSYKDFKEYVIKLKGFPKILLTSIKGKSSKTLDRLDGNGDYEPGNIKWSTPMQQMHNRMDNRYVVYNGKTFLLKTLCKSLGANYELAVARLSRKWSVEDAVSPKLCKGKQKEHMELFEWYMKEPIRIRNIQGANLPVSPLTYFVEVSKELGYTLFEMREFECPYKSEVPCYELVMKNNGDTLSFGSSIHSFQFFTKAKGIVYTSNLHPTAHYFARVEFTAIMMELYPRCSSSDLVRKFMAKMKDKTGNLLALRKFKEHKKNVRSLQMLFLLNLLSQAVREKRALKNASNTK